MIFLDKPLSVKPEMVISGDDGALLGMRHVPATGLTARRGTHVFLQPDGRRDRRRPHAHPFSTTAGLCALFCLWWRRCGAMSSRSKAEHWAQELEAVAGRIAPQFGRAEPRRRALTYLQGLLAPLERKNGWLLAEA